MITKFPFVPYNFRDAFAIITRKNIMHDTGIMCVILLHNCCSNNDRLCYRRGLIWANAHRIRPYSKYPITAKINYLYKNIGTGKDQ